MYTGKSTEEANENAYNIYSEESVHTKAHVAVARNDKVIHRKPEYISTMEIDVENIDRDDKKIWRTIIEAID